jgi:hypothetical protein
MMSLVPMLLIVAGIVTLVTSAIAQTNGAMYTRNGRYSMQGINATTPSVLIQAAYNVRDFQILEAPGG